MFATFLHSAGLHLSWWVRSFVPGAHPGAPLGLRRLAFLALVFPLFCALQGIHWVAFVLDECFFRDYRRVEVREPLFIVGIPRSGTTYAHRELAVDDETFTTFSTWEAILAPSITERKMVAALDRLDHRLGGPGRRAIEWLTHRAAGDVHAVHEVSPGAPEEDYLALLPAGSCFLMRMAFPFSEWLRDTARLEAMDPPARERLVGFYRRCLQKHLYCAPEGARLLSKNAAFVSWLGELRRTFPDARFVVTVREPGAALGSQLRAIEPARQFFGTDPEGDETTADFARLFARNYRVLRDFVGDGATDRVALVETEELRADPGALLSAAAERLGLSLSPRLRTHLESLPPGEPGARGHVTPGFDGLAAGEEDTPHTAYDAVLSLPQRIRLNQTPVT